MWTEILADGSGIALTLAVIPLILGLSEFGRVVFRFPCELTRKFSHIAGGLWVLVCPYLIQSRYTMAALSVAFAALLDPGRFCTR